MMKSCASFTRIAKRMQRNAATASISVRGSEENESGEHAASRNDFAGNSKTHASRPENAIS
jgi:hypothetical protein